MSKKKYIEPSMSVILMETESMLASSNFVENTIIFIGLYNDDEEDYESELGYWVEDDLDTNRIMRITIFIKEVLDEEVFFTYDWTRN